MKSEQNPVKKLQLFDTYRRGIYPFYPISDEVVSIYICGPTVYNYAHIGNLRNYVFVDVLKRVLRINDYTVQDVMNITDVGHLSSDADSGEDKMQIGARQQQRCAWEIAKYFETAFLDDLTALEVSHAGVVCRATEHIDEQISYIVQLEAKGFTYQTPDGIYFDTQMLDSYGYIARLNIAGRQGGKRVDLGHKRHLTDFALWKFSVTKDDTKERQMQWSSPWGTGFPGWHIECSAMSEKYLGPRFDIHVGGEDHISVHHANEIAQCEARYGEQPASFWMHGRFLQLDGEKLSKSGKSLRLLDLVNRGYEPLDFRYLLLTSHYRSHLNFSIKALNSAARALKRLRTMLATWPSFGEINFCYKISFVGLVNHDLKMPQALAVLWQVTKSGLSNADKKATIYFFDKILGLSLSQQVAVKEYPQAIIDLANNRDEARKNQRWQQSDAIRKELSDLGYLIVDGKSGYKIKRI